MLLRVIVGLLLCWQISANAAQPEVQLEKIEAVKAEVAKVQRLIQAYNLNLKIKLTDPTKSAARAAVLDPKLQKTLNLRAFATVVKCDDGETVVVPDPGHGHDRDDDQACSPYCEGRWSDGSCRSWGADRCGHNIDCSPYCEARWSDGSCRSWGADVCN